MKYRACISKCDGQNNVIWGWRSERWVTNTYKTERCFLKYAVPNKGRYLVEVYTNALETYGHICHIFVVNNGKIIELEKNTCPN